MPRSLLQPIRIFALTLVCLIWLSPYIWMTLTSLKTLPEIVEAPLYPIPRSIQFSAFTEVFQTIPVIRCFLTTIVMSLSIAFLQIVFALPAGYALAKLDFVGKKLCFMLVLLCLLVPVQVTFIPIFSALGSLGLVNTLSALILPFSISALGTFLIRQALLSVPNEIIEAARMDGASEIRIIYGILAPILKPTLISVFLFSFVFHYNDYFWPLVMTTDDHVRTLPLAIALLREQGTGVRWHVVMAGNVVLSLPVLLLFSFVQKHIVAAIAKPTS